jgi:hypothetical protein
MSKEIDLAARTTHLVLAYRSLQRTVANIIKSMCVRFWERYLTRNRCLPLLSDVHDCASSLCHRLLNIPHANGASPCWVLEIGRPQLRMIHLGLILRTRYGR